MKNEKFNQANEFLLEHRFINEYYTWDRENSLMNQQPCHHYFVLKPILFSNKKDEQRPAIILKYNYRHNKLVNIFRTPLVKNQFGSQIIDIKLLDKKLFIACLYYGTGEVHIGAFNNIKLIALNTIMKLSASSELLHEYNFSNYKRVKREGSLRVDKVINTNHKVEILQKIKKHI